MVAATTSPREPAVSDDVIYLQHPTGLRRLERNEFEREDDLQSILADHPQLLGGAQMATGVRFLLLRKEAPVRDGEFSGNRWSVDHLMIDQFARPTIIEVKRSSDTRLRREVIGQLLEYASNATAYWRRGELLQMAEMTHGDALEDRLEELIGGPTPDDFWAQADDNLSDGRVRLLLVADVVPPEARRIIEFLNDHMPELEVAAVEIAHYTAGDFAAYVPRIHGQTERAKQAKTARAGLSQRTTPDEFLSQLASTAAKWVQGLLKTAEPLGLTPYWGTKGVSIGLQTASGRRSLVYVYPPGTYGKSTAAVYVYLGQYPEDHHGEVVSHLTGIGWSRSGGRTLTLDLDAEPEFSPAQLLGRLLPLIQDPQPDA